MKEYRIIPIEATVNETENLLNELGNEGYEIIETTNPSSYHSPYIIMRQKESVRRAKKSFWKRAKDDFENIGS